VISLLIFLFFFLTWQVPQVVVYDDVSELKAIKKSIRIILSKRNFLNAFVIFSSCIIILFLFAYISNFIPYAGSFIGTLSFGLILIISSNFYEEVKKKKKK